MIIDVVEEEHWAQFARFKDVPECTWSTPDGDRWTPQKVIVPHQNRVSNRLAWCLIHYWKLRGLIEVEHVELPNPLMFHRPSDPAWSYIDERFGPGELEPEVYPLGRADLFCPRRKPGDAHLMVEFGKCQPLKFTTNLGFTDGRTHWMIVPYGSAYAFVFIPVRPPLMMPIDANPFTAPKERLRIEHDLGFSPRYPEDEWILNGIVEKVCDGKLSIQEGKDILSFVHARQRENTKRMSR